MIVTAVARADTDDARSHFKQGTAYFTLGKYAEAAVEYERAYELHQDPALLYNAAQAQRMAGNKPRALLLYQNYLRFYGDNATNHAEVERFVAQLQKAIDGDRAATSTPPTEPVKTELPPAAAPAPSPSSDPPHAAPERKKLKPWVWGVIGGAAAVVVGVSLGVGLGVGLSGNKDPSPSAGRIQW
jgi:tetratricopeptide (TPR) repeat protein